MEDLLFVLLALISSISRALINVIDRWQFSYKNEDVVKTSFLNNGLPAFVLLSCLILFGSKNHLLNNILSIKACLFGLVMQVVALIFSMALKKYQIYQVTLISKISDFSIPAFSSLLNNSFNLIQLALHGFSALISLPFFIKANLFKSVGWVYCTLIFGCLTLQASVAPFLSGFTDGFSDFYSLLYFGAGVIFWRASWMFLPLIFSRKISFKSLTILPSKITYLRVILTLLTQLSFIYIISDNESHFVIPILNLTGFFSILMASFCMSEKINHEIWLLIILTLMLCGVSVYV